MVTSDADLRLVQFLDAGGTRRVAMVDVGGAARAVAATDSVYGLAHRALTEQTSAHALAREFAAEDSTSVASLVDEGQLLPAADHPVDVERCSLWFMDTSPRLIGNGERLPDARTPTATTPSWASVTAALALAYTVDAHGHAKLLGVAQALVNDAGGPDARGHVAIGPELAEATTGESHAPDRWLSDTGPRNLSAQIALTHTDTPLQHASVTLEMPASTDFALLERTLFESVQNKAYGDVVIGLLGATPIELPDAQMGPHAVSLTIDGFSQASKLELSGSTS